MKYFVKSKALTIFMTVFCVINTIILCHSLSVHGITLFGIFTAIILAFNTIFLITLLKKEKTRIITYVNAPHELTLKDCEGLIQDGKDNPHAHLDWVTINNKPFIVLYNGSLLEAKELLELKYLPG